MMTSAEVSNDDDDDIGTDQGSGAGIRGRGCAAAQGRVPPGGVVAVGLQSGGRSGLCCPGGSQTNINAVDGGGRWCGCCFPGLPELFARGPLPVPVEQQTQP